jgi:hypothetical protein
MIFIIISNVHDKQISRDIFVILVTTLKVYQILTNRHQNL